MAGAGLGGGGARAAGCGADMGRELEKQRRSSRLQRRTLGWPAAAANPDAACATCAPAGPRATPTDAACTNANASACACATTAKSPSAVA